MFPGPGTLARELLPHAAGNKFPRYPKMHFFVGSYHTSRAYIGSMAQENRMNVISNNLANVNTPGFKKDVPIFDGYMLQRTKTSFEQGQFRETGNKLDLALSGPGFFQVETPEGVRYTRNGSFTLSALGEVVTNDGYPVVGAGVIPEDTSDLSVTENGRLLADGVEVGQFDLVEFEDPQVLAKQGADLYVPKAEGVAGVEAESTEVTQGFLENSNVNSIMESVNMIDTLRTYEIFQKVMATFQEADQKIINEVGRLV